MKTKWYISALIVVLAVFGVLQNQASLPNQEVHIRFEDQTVTLEQSEQTIALIQEQLEAIDVTNIVVEKDANKQLKISYHSNLDVVVIKSLLSKALQIEIASGYLNLEENQSNLPKKTSKKGFDFDVYEIKTSSKNQNNSAGKSIIVTKQDYDRSSNTNLPFYLDAFVAIDFLNISVLKQNISSQYHLTFSNKTYTIPEVRAGPFSFQS